MEYPLEVYPLEVYRLEVDWSPAGSLGEFRAHLPGLLDCLRERSDCRPVVVQGMMLGYRQVQPAGESPFREPGWSQPQREG